jgi:Concanavalin A-like lectin/glucanases superfamily
MKGRVPLATYLAGLAAIALSACGTGPIDAIGLAPGGLPLGLLAHWTFDEGADTVVHDSSGNHHDGTVVGTTYSWLAQGRFGGALHLEQGDSVTVDSFPDATPGWTVSTWVQIASKDVGMGDVTVISTENVFHGGWELNLTAIATDLHYHFGFWTGPSLYDYAHCECTNCIVPDRWQHVTAVVDGVAGRLSLYLDDALLARVQVPRAISPGVPTLYMGRWATVSEPRLLLGSLDDIAIWSRPLASDEIALLTQAPAP